MKSVRLDSGTLSLVREDSGVLKAKVNLSRTGVFPYVYSDGTVLKEAKLPEELFRQSVFDSANGAVITDEHPSQKSDSEDGLVHSGNYSKLSKGNVFDVRRDGEFLVGVEKIYDADLKSRILAGEQVQVSIGFTANLDYTPGEFNGEKYDAVQRDIVINHLAHVPQGRAGEECRAFLDNKSADNNYAIQQELNAMNIDYKKNKTLTLRVDGKDVQVTPEIMNAYEAVKKAGLLSVKKDADPVPADPNAPPAEAPADMPPSDMPAEPVVDMAKIQEQMKTLDAILNMIQSKFGINFDQLESWMDTREAMIEAYKNQNAAGSVDAAVQDAINTVRIADALQIKTDGLSTKQIKLAVIKEHLPSLKRVDSMSDSELSVAFSSAVEMSKFKAQNVQSKHDASETVVLDDMKKRAEEAKQAYLNRGKK